MLSRSVTVTFRKEGWHCWPEAPERRAYLREKHRHLFHVAVSLQVGELDREIEFHDLLHECRWLFTGGDMGARSCEDMAEGIIASLSRNYPNRPMSVTVSEDGEVGATVAYAPDDSEQEGS